MGTRMMGAGQVGASVSAMDGPGVSPDGDAKADADGNASSE
jgi:hypothetical protein